MKWNYIWYKYELKLGNGYIKEFHENGFISFEGEIKNGKGKIFDQCGHLIFIFDGHFDNEVKNGVGKIYNHSGDLIFDGEFKNGKKLEGNIYEYNKQCELIYKKEKGQYNHFKSRTNYTNNLMIKYCFWIMEENQNNQFEGEYKDGIKYNGKGKEYNNKGKLIFEGEYKNGKIYKGKEYNNKGKLIFKREYKYKDKAKRIDFFSDRLIVEKEINSNVYIFKSI